MVLLRIHTGKAKSGRWFEESCSVSSLFLPFIISCHVFFRRGIKCGNHVCLSVLDISNFVRRARYNRAFFAAVLETALGA